MTLFSIIFLSVADLNCQQVRDMKFVINDFVVHVDKFSNQSGLGQITNKPGMSKKTAITSIDVQKLLEVRVGNKFSGTGTIDFMGHSLPITFSDIIIKTDQNRAFVATSGIVKGKKRTKVKYRLGEYAIVCRWESVKIKPAEASSMITATVPMHSCSTTAPDIRMVSSSCRIYNDGSVNGINFKGSGDFKIKESIYTLNVTEGTSATIKLGDKAPGRKPEKGAFFEGTESYGLFIVYCRVAEDASDSYITMKLIKPVNRRLEYNLQQEGDPLGLQFYFVRLKSGSVKIRYAKDTLFYYGGEFDSRLKLPSRFDKLADIQTGEVIDTFSVVLYTDKTNALFDSINLINPSTGNSYRFKIGPVTFRPDPYKAWVYFPKWTENSSEYAFSKNMQCSELENLFSRLNENIEDQFDKNPGVTITKGIAFLTSPQVSYRYTGELSDDHAKTIKTIFSGHLTFTPYGVHGIAHSEENTFIPLTYPIEESKNTRLYTPVTWDEIISKGDTLPEKVNELFFLQELRILQMQLKVMKICMNEIDTESTYFCYYVHFPHPSYVNIEFEDNSFTREGLFTKAYGPISLLAEEDLGYRTSVTTEEFEKGKKIVMDTIQVPWGYVLWAWRLPVTFADRGIEIDYDQLKSNSEKGITITMSDLNRNNLGEIYSNEFALSPLYSDNSAFRKGVMFKGFLSIDGMFNLDSWDKTPWFGKSYSKKFRCDLRTVTLASLESRPASRRFDFTWAGGLQFPFFCDAETDSWQRVGFMVKDAEPFMPDKADLGRKSRRGYECSDGVYTCTNTGEAITLNVSKLYYDNSLGGFLCDQAVREVPERTGRLELFSYHHALFIEDGSPGIDKILKVTNGSGCNSKKVVEKIIDARISPDGITDLVCYDTLASADRNTKVNNASCCQVFYYGTYQIVTHNSTSDSTVTFSATNARYYPYETVNKLNFENSQVCFRSDDNSEGSDNKLDIPGIHMTHTSRGYIGAFGSTYTDAAMKIPYEGEFRFFLDPECGYFYMLGAGSFTYGGITFRGQVFLFHAKRSILDIHPFNPDYCTPLIDDMAERSLSDKDEFLNDTQLGKVGDETVITGMLSTGGASFGFNWYVVDVDIKAGLTHYIYHSNEDRSFRAGLFAAANAEAKVELMVFSVKAKGDVRLALLSQIPTGDYTSVFNSIAGTDLNLHGTLTLCGCASFLGLGKCCGGFTTGATFSRSDGLHLNDADLDGCCGCDDCPFN